MISGRQSKFDTLSLKSNQINVKYEMCLIRCLLNIETSTKNSCPSKNDI